MLKFFHEKCLTFHEIFAYTYLKCLCPKINIQLILISYVKEIIPKLRRTHSAAFAPWLGTPWLCPWVGEWIPGQLPQILILDKQIFGMSSIICVTTFRRSSADTTFWVHAGHVTGGGDQLNPPPIPPPSEPLKLKIW